MFALDEICSLTGNKPSYSNHRIINEIPPRIQWNANDGYCGEVSLISAGLYYGQYVSQYDARVFANIDISLKLMQLHQILIGRYGTWDRTNNVRLAAKNMHLKYQEFLNYPYTNYTSEEFILWI